MSDRLTKTTLILLVLVGTSMSQERSPEYELMGAFATGFSRSVQEKLYFNEYDSKTRTVTFSSLTSVGYFFDTSWQAVIGVEFKGSWSTSNSYVISSTISGDERLREYYYDIESYSLGLVGSVRWNVAMDSSFLAFAGPSIGVDWLWFRHSYITRRTRWSKPEIRFPSGAIGVRWFVTESWAMVAQFQFVKSVRTERSNEVSNSQIVFQIGISVFL